MKSAQTKINTREHVRPRSYLGFQIDDCVREVAGRRDCGWASGTSSSPTLSIVDRMRTWLVASNRTIMGIICSVLGLVPGFPVPRLVVGQLVAVSDR